jgi:hypothetical protein
MLALAAEPPEASQQVAAFIAEFEAAYGGSGVRHPAWVAANWRDAATTAHRAFKFLLVYLHSPEHEDTDAFAREVLCCPEVVAYVDEHFVAWGGSIRAPDAFSLSGRLNVSTYPCIALLAFSGSRTKLVAAAQGALRPRQLLAMLRRVQEEQSVMLTAERLEQEERVRFCWAVVVVVVVVVACAGAASTHSAVLTANTPNPSALSHVPIHHHRRCRGSCWRSRTQSMRPRWRQTVSARRGARSSSAWRRRPHAPRRQRTRAPGVCLCVCVWWGGGFGQQHWALA